MNHPNRPAPAPAADEQGHPVDPEIEAAGQAHGSDADGRTVVGRIPSVVIILAALRRWWSVGLLPVLNGCTRADRSSEIDFFGSYFPAWMICIISGLILTSLARLVLIRLRIDVYLRPAPLVYFCLIAVFTFVIWLLLFNP